MQATSNLINLTKAEAVFRTMAFRIFYDRVFANVEDLTARFLYAITSSAREMKDRNLFQAWWAWTRGKGMKGLLDSGNEPPPELRPFVVAYLNAVGERAKQTGDDIADLI